MFFMVKSPFRVFILTKVPFLLLLVFLNVHVLFRICLLIWINSLLDLLNVFLLGILELRKDTGATVLPTGSIFLFVGVTFFEYVPYFSPPGPVTASEFISLPSSVLLA